jgi:hypothetical protein
MIRYRSIRPPETALRQRLNDLANEPRWFGYRRLFNLLRCEGEPSGINRIYRLYRGKGWRCANAGQGARLLARVPRSWSRHGPMPFWSLDFVHVMTQ